MKHYYEAFEKGGWWRWKVYHYDPADNREVIVARSELSHETKEEALDAASDWLDDHPEIDATLA